jgi:molybdopterin-guanine dinucleotide biosynthesis protein A
MDFMETAGFVLAGGQSSRMGRDKALLELDGMTLIEQIAAKVREAAGSVTIVGAPERYSHLGLAVIADGEAGQGPLGGIVTALETTTARWNLVTACDMPFITKNFLHQLMELARDCGAEALVPLSGDGRPQPLCAVYRQSCGARLADALRAGTRKVTTALERVQVEYRQVEEIRVFRNVNSPSDWEVCRHG